MFLILGESRPDGCRGRLRSGGSKCICSTMPLRNEGRFFGLRGRTLKPNFVPKKCLQGRTLQGKLGLDFLFKVVYRDL